MSYPSCYFFYTEQLINVIFARTRCKSYFSQFCEFRLKKVEIAGEDG